MKCPNCQFENPEDKSFCGQCGAKMERTCPACLESNPPTFKFCGECGHSLTEPKETERKDPAFDSERKHATVVFADLVGYTAMTESLDPEDVKEIMSRIFGEIAQVVTKYEGFIERFFGDEVMALFGVPKAHEDDPVRAIKAAREIHEVVESLSPKYEVRTGHPLAMHTGINTGLLVTGDEYIGKERHGLTGDAINTASRLRGLAKAGEILVGYETYRQAEGYFDFEELKPTEVKGKTEAVSVYRMVSPKKKPVTLHRLSGLRADLIGRKMEIAQLMEAVENLRNGKGSIFSIFGDAGTGKSRLVEEFKTSLKSTEIQWFEGHAYPYAQNIPYFPLIDLLNRVLQIEEGDPSEKVREKVETGIRDLVGKEHSIPFVGSLYSLPYPEVEDMSPDFWRFRLQEAIQAILSAIARKTPTIYFLEDLHWADPSFVELLRRALLEIRQPAIVLCVYRPEFNLFSSHQLVAIGKTYKEIRLRDLSSSHALSMLESLLETETIPHDLRQFVQQKAEGNPFYLEELINSLIESETLVRDNGSWKITRPITESAISSTIHGLISGRLDQLENETKRILQEASVIGRAFLYEILKKITELEERIDRGLSTLERIDLIRTRAMQPDLEYMFKHPLTQEVVYNGLLKKDRQVIHEQIALVMENLFKKRLPEFYETLAFHFKQGHSTHKAVDYLMKSAEKSAKKNAVEESHQYYKEAFDLLFNKADRSYEDNLLLIDILIQWAFVFSYRGDIKGLDELLRTHVELAESVGDKARLGAYYGWLAVALWFRERFKKAYQYLLKGLKLGEEAESQQVIGEVCTWLCYVGGELGLFEEAIKYGERAHTISKTIESDHWLYIKSLDALGYVYSAMGNKSKVMEIGKDLLDYSHKHSYIRGIILGHCEIGRSHLIDGDIESAIESFKKGTQVAGDPMYYQVSNIYLGISYLLYGQTDQAQNVFKEVLDFSQKFGVEAIGSVAQGCLYVISISKGEMSQGLKMFEDAVETYVEIGRKYWAAEFEHIIGRIFSQIAERTGPINLSMMFKNINFLLRNVPFASKKAEYHFNKTIEVAKEIGAKGVLGQTYFDLGLLYKSKKRSEQAKECISEAINTFKLCGAETYLKQAKEVLASLK